MSKNKMNVKFLVACSTSIALVTFFTMFFRIPIMGGRIYFHMGELIILLVAMQFGKKQGTLAGALGAAIADVLVGATVWAPISFILRGFEGYMAGCLLQREKGIVIKHWLLMLLVTFVIAVGYTIATYYLYGEAAAIMEVAGDLVQGIVSIVLAAALSNILRDRFRI